MASGFFCCQKSFIPTFGLEVLTIKNHGNYYRVIVQFIKRRMSFWVGKINCVYLNISQCLNSVFESDLN